MLIYYSGTEEQCDDQKTYYILLADTLSKMTYNLRKHLGFGTVWEQEENSKC